MKTIDISAYTIIKEGVEICVQRTPADCTQSAPIDGLLPTMERNEGAVFWLQPKNGTVDQQEACICVNGTFYMLNSKFEKAIFRSVRLTRDFQNYERLVDGTRKLVIPRRLFHEKLRTSRRVSYAIIYVLLCLLVTEHEEQVVPDLQGAPVGSDVVGRSLQKHTLNARRQLISVPHAPALLHRLSEPRLVTHVRPQHNRGHFSMAELLRQYHVHLYVLWNCMPRNRHAPCVV